KTKTLRPRLPASIAQNKPAAPPPIIMTSLSKIEPGKRDTELRKSRYPFARLESAMSSAPNIKGKGANQGRPKSATRCRLRPATTTAPIKKRNPNGRRTLVIRDDSLPEK